MGLVDLIFCQCQAGEGYEGETSVWASAINGPILGTLATGISPSVDLAGISQ